MTSSRENVTQKLLYMFFEVHSSCARILYRTKLQLQQMLNTPTRQALFVTAPESQEIPELFFYLGNTKKTNVCYGI